MLRMRRIHGVVPVDNQSMARAKAVVCAEIAPGGPADEIEFCDRLQWRDVERVRRLVETTGFFSAAEVELAVELVTERLTRGPASGYEFIMAERGDELDGYACFGPIPATAASYDLYWIAVPPDCQGRGLGRRLLAEVERRVRAAGGRQIYIDTSRRPQYESTRAFYEGCGYELGAVLDDFYGPGDDKAIYYKKLD